MTLLTQALADSPQTILKTLTDTILDVLNAGSSGISLLTEDGTRFVWPAVSGVWAPHVGGGTPRVFGPCGDVLERNAVLLFKHPERRYTYLTAVTPGIEECLLAPFYVQGKAVGTVWVVAHDKQRKFDAEDRRQLVSLSKLASAAYQTTAFMDALKVHRESLSQDQTHLVQNVTELKKAHEISQDSRRAALNLLEDTVQARVETERLNAELRESEERFRFMADSMPQKLFTAQPNGEMDYFNEQFMEFTGLTFDQIKGFAWKRFIHPDDAEETIGSWQKSIESGEAFQFEHRFQRADGEYRWHLSRARPMRDAYGHVTMWIGSSHRYRPSEADSNRI